METLKREFVKIELTERIKKAIERIETSEKYEDREYAKASLADLFLNQLACQEKAPWTE